MEDNVASLERVKCDAFVYTDKNDGDVDLQLIIFKLGKEEYAMDIDHVKEVIITPRAEKVPEAPQYVKGVAQIRGNVIAIMDLEAYFNVTDSEKLNANSLISNYTLVVENEGFKVGILVKEVPDTLSIRVSDIDSSSHMLRYAALGYRCIRGIVKSEGRTIIIIDVFKLLTIDENIKKINSI